MSSPKPKAVATVQLENDRVIVTEWRFAPGAETGWHVHGFDYVVIPMLTGQLHIETKDGDHAADLVAGQAYSRNAGVGHNVINANGHEFVFVEIEIK
ncbi:MAG: cupin domain-containing protein [Arenicellales bacterium WSBS_2016_MAG_OTU3]